MKKFNRLGVSPYAMAGRIVEREDNHIYKREFIYDILKMYIDEIYKALLKGERIQLTGIGTIIPEVKPSKIFNLPVCNKEDGNPPYTKLRMTRTDKLIVKMNNTLLKNIEKGIYGLEELPFTEKQMDILKECGYIPDDAKIEIADE